MRKGVHLRSSLDASWSRTTGFDSEEDDVRRNVGRLWDLIKLKKGTLCAMPVQMDLFLFVAI